MQKLGYYNGKYGELEEMTVPMNDRVCFFGDGVYDATYSRNYKIFALDEHLDRFFNSAALLKMEVPHTKKELGDILQEMVSKMDTGENFVYWQLTRGTGVRNHVFPECKANVWITLVPKDIVDTYAKIKLTTMEDTRFFHCNIKTSRKEVRSLVDSFLDKLLLVLPSEPVEPSGKDGEQQEDD